MSSIFIEKVKKHTAAIEEAGIDFDKIAQTPYFAQYLQGFLTSLTAHRDQTATLKLLFPEQQRQPAHNCGSCGENCHEQQEQEDPDAVKYARLDGRTITINMRNPLIESFVTTENKMFCTMGLLFHEVAHLRYMDFRGEQAALKELEYGRLPYEKEFLASGPRLPGNFMEAVRFDPFVPVFTRLYGDLANVISDYHDEQMLLKHSGSLVRKSIYTLREAQYAHATAVEELAQDKDNGMFAIALALIMQYARYGRIFVYNEKEDPGQFYVRFLRYIKKELDAAIAAKNVKEKYLALDALIARLWTFVNIDQPEASSRSGQADIEQDKELEYEFERDDMYYEAGDKDEESMRSEVDEDADETDETENSGNGMDDSEEGEDGDESSGGAPAQKGKESEQPGDMQNAMSKAFSGSGGDTFSEQPGDILGGSDPSDSASDDPGAMDAPPAGGTDGGTDPTEIIQQALDRMEGNYIEEEAKDRAVQEIASDHLISIRNGNAISPHRGVQTDIIRRKASGGDKQAYEAIVRKNSALIKKTEREIRKIIQEETIALQRRRMTGRCIDTRNLYKVDQRYFMKKKNPDKVLDMAIAVLVDNSGSMKGRRMESAKEAAVLMTEVLESLEIPSMIAAHNCKGWPQIYMYKYFEDTKQSKYSICQMEPNGDNRDGLAIEFVGQYLAERDEKDKLFIIISDGQPNASGYTGEPAKQDIRQIVRRLRTNEVKTIAFAIGDDKPQIHEIYGEAFVDISDYDKFPKIFAKMIEREIISRL